jgi:threonine dehydrogenase-like Zn-dependent dehydrogenase
MWTSTLDLSPKRVIATRLLRPFWPGVCFSSLAPLRVQNVPRQSLPASNWVRVRNRLAGICGTDLHLIFADGDLRIAPAAIPGHQQFYLGHEVVGEVIEIGDDVQQLHVGDRVTLQHNPNCLSAGIQPLCRSCAVGNYNLCEQGMLPGPEPIGGGWSEEMLLHEQQLFRLPTQLNDEQAVLIEPAAVALHAVLRRPPQAGERILIIGAGTIGLLTLQIVRALAPQARISVLARHGFQVEQATRQGAAHIIYPQDSYIGIQRATDAQLYQRPAGNRMLLGGYDVIYDTVGQGKTLHHALRWAHARATVVLVGVSLHMMRIDLTPIWYQEVNLIGSLGHGMETWPIGTNERRATFSIVAEMIERGAIRPEQLITHHFALDNYRHALTTAASKANSRAIKVVFDYSLQPASVVPTVRASARQPRPATVGTRPATRPLAKSSSHPTDQAALPVTPLPSVPLTPLIDEPEMSEHVEQPAPASPAPTPAPSPLASVHKEPENDDHGDLEDTLVALPAIRKPFKPVKLVPTAPAPSNHTTTEQKSITGPIPEPPAGPVEAADTPAAESGAGTSALPFELPVANAQPAAMPFVSEPELPGPPVESEMPASEIIEADSPVLAEATQEARPSDSFETGVPAPPSETSDTSQLFYEFVSESALAAPEMSTPSPDAATDTLASEVAEQPAVASAEASFQFYEWENEPGTAIDAAIAGTLEPSYEFVSQLFATPETTGISSENTEERPLLELAEPAAPVESDEAVELPGNASPIDAAQPQTSEEGNVDEVSEPSDAATAVASPIESAEAETVEIVGAAGAIEAAEIPEMGKPENAAEEMEVVAIAGATGTTGAIEPLDTDASPELPTSSAEEPSVEEPSAAKESEELPLPDEAIEEMPTTQESNEPPLQNGTEGASGTKKRPRSRKKNRT